MADRGRPVLFGADGRPVALKAGDDPLGDLVRQGVKDMGDSFVVDKDVLLAVQQERARALAMTAVPRTPRHMLRDAGGIAVAKGQGRWPNVTMDMLRALRETAPILKPIHKAREYQTRRMSQKWNGIKGEVGIRIVHKHHKERDQVQPEGIKPYIERAESILFSPAPSYNYGTLAAANASLMEDLLTINRPVVEIIPSAVDPRRVVQVLPADGALIWETLTWIEKWMADNPRWSVGYDVGRLSSTDMLDVVSHAIDHDLHGADYCLVRDGIVEAVYPRGRLIVAPIQNRTDHRYVGYPPSHVEESISLVSAFINTFEYNSSYFTKGMLAEFILGLPAGMHDDDVDAFVDMFREASQGGPNAWRPPIVPLPNGKDTITKIDLKQSNTDMGFEIWLSLLVALCTAVYRMDPSTINAKPWSGGGGAALSEANRSQEIQLAKEEGLQGDLGHLCDNIWTPIVRRCHRDLIVVGEYGDFDPQKHAEVNQLRASTTKSRNEIRVEDGDIPRGFYLTEEKYKTATPEDQQKHEDNQWNWPTDPGFASAKNQAQQLELQKQGMAQQATQGQQQDFSAGHDDGFGGKDDGFGGKVPGHDPSPYGTPGGGAPPKPPTATPRPPGPPGGAPPSGGLQPPKPVPLAKGRPITVFVTDGD